MNPFFEKLFWKTYFRRKKKEAAVFYRDGVRKLKDPETYKYFRWRLLKDGKKRESLLPTKKENDGYFISQDSSRFFSNHRRSPVGS